MKISGLFLQDKQINLKGNYMKTKTEYINNHKITIIQEPSKDLNDDLPDEIEFNLSTIKQNPYLKNDYPSIKLEPDIARYFKNSKQVNPFLRKHLKEIELEVV